MTPPNSTPNKLPSPPTAIPCFFFSYARSDYGPWLTKFFTELKGLVGKRGRRDDAKGEVSFRDLDDIDPGADWEETLAIALSKCLTMVSVYTPWYFGRPYCGKEFQVLLERQRAVIDRDGRAKGSTKIVPVLWESWADLERLELPPAVAKSIQVTGGKHDKIYKERGLRALRRHNRVAFDEILENLVTQLLELSTRNPLPPAERVPSLDATRNAFETINAPRTVAEAGPDAVLLVYLRTATQDVARARAERYGTSHPGDWHPLGVGPEGGIYLVVRETVAVCHFRDFIEPDYDLSAPNAAATILDHLIAAKAKNIPAFVIADPWLLTSCQGRDILGAIRNERRWTGAIIVPQDPGDRLPADYAADVEAFTSIPPEEAHRLICSSPTTPLEFRIALLTILTELQKRVAATGIVQNEVSGVGPSTPPVLRGPAKRSKRA